VGGDRLVKPCQGGIDFRGGAAKSEGRSRLMVLNEKGEWGEAGLDAKDWDWGRGGAVGDPSLDHSPNHVQTVLHLQKGGGEVSPIEEDWGNEGGGQDVA